MAGGSAGEPALPQVVTVEEVETIASIVAATVAVDVETLEGRRLRLILPLVSARKLLFALGDLVLDEAVLLGPLESRGEGVKPLR